MRAVKQNLPAVAGILVGALPFGGYPACLPVYAGVLSALGASFLLSSAYLLPVTVAFLLIGIATLGFRARQRRAMARSHLELPPRRLSLPPSLPLRHSRQRTAASVF